LIYNHLCKKPSGRAKFLQGSQGKESQAGKSAWQVLKVAFLFPVLEEIPPPKGAWDRVKVRLVPLEAEGTIPIRDF